MKRSIFTKAFLNGEPLTQFSGYELREVFYDLRCIDHPDTNAFREQIIGEMVSRITQKALSGKQIDSDEVWVQSWT